MSDQNEPKSDKSRKPRSVIETTLYFGLTLTFIVGLAEVVGDQSKLPVSFLALFCVFSFVLVYDRLNQIFHAQPTVVDYSLRTTRERRRAAKAKALGLPERETPQIPKHYTIGEEGQIVEVKPECKRSKKPHQY